MLTEKQDLSPVPDEEIVIRLARPPKDYEEKGEILAIQLDDAFQLSTEDRKSIPPHLSVWVASCTTPEQAYGFLLENLPNSALKLILRLKVAEIRAIVGSADMGITFPNLLDVLWIFRCQNLSGELVQDSRLGADGHAGIVGLGEQSKPEELTKRQAKNLRKDLRSKLAELASKDNYLLSIDNNQD